MGERERERERWEREREVGERVVYLSIFFFFFLSSHLSFFLIFFFLSFPHFSRTVKRRGREKCVGLRLSLTLMCRPLKSYRSITFFFPLSLFFFLFLFLSPRSDSSLSLSLSLSLLPYILLAASLPHLSLSFFLSFFLSSSFFLSFFLSLSLPPSIYPVHCLTPLYRSL